MLKSDAAAFLAGVKQVEGAAASAPTNLHVITGEVGTTSEEGKTTISIDGLVFSEEDSQEIEIDTLGGLEEGDIATVILTGESGHGMTPLAIGAPGSVDRLKARVVETELLIADKADIEDLEAATARIGDLEADHVSVNTLEAATARIETLEVDHVSIADFEVEQANIDNLQAATADIDTIRANSAKVQNLTAAQLEADHATIGTLDTTYMHADMANADVAWIQNGTIKDGAIVSAMINDVSANKLTAGTINGSVINVTNLNADNITAGTINGQRIGEGSLSLDKLSEDVYTETEVNTIVDGLNDRIDGAIETFTGTAVPTLNNSPASSWNTTKLRDEHVGDVYYVVNSQSQQNGYCYRFTKSGSTYSWQLIKDSDVTAALSRLTTAEGKITSIESFDSTVSSFMTNTDSELTSVKSRATSLETRMTDAEGDISEKVDTSTFNSLSQTVDANTASITSLSSTVSQKADGSTVTTLTNRVSTVEQDVDGIETSIGELQTTVSEKADSSTLTTVSNRLNTVSDTVDGHTSQLSSITTTQTTMQTTLDKTVKSSIQLWYSKANTTAPSKPTSQVTSTSTSGNAWRIVVPAYNASYPHYYYCWQYEYVDGTYGWSAVVRDIAMGESQSTARTADSNASAAVTTANTASTNASTALSTANTANTNASDAKTAAATANTTASEAKTTAETASSDASTAKTNAASAVTTANSANTKANANIKSSVQLWFTKANSTAPNKPTSVVSTSNANTANAWNLVVPVWNSSYPHYFYCYQQQKGDGNYQWTDVVYDRATSEAQQLANTTSTNLSTLQTNYATFKQQTEQFESTVGTTYATKTELKGATDDITELEGRVSTNETSISNNASAIALKANSSDVYTKSGVGGLISTEVTNRNAAITAKANEITSTVSQTYTTKEEFKNLEIGGRNLLRGSYSGDGWVNYTTLEDGVFTRRTTSTSETYILSGNATSGSTQYLMLDLNTTYTLSCWAKSNGFVKSMDMHCYDQSTKNIKTRTGIALTTDWVKYEFTFTTPTEWQSGSSPTGFLCRFDNNGSTTSGTAAILYVKWPMLERGNKATDWTPAPEDIETRVSAAESSITQNANNIALKVSETDVTGNYLIGKINLDSTTASIAAQRINLQGAVTISDLASDAQNATLNSNISVGGRNLLRSTGDFAGWLTSGNYAGSATEGIWTFPAPSSLNWSNVGSPIPNLALSDYDGETLTLSFDYRSDDFSDTSGSHCVCVNVHGYASAYTGTRTKYRQISTPAFNGVFVPTTKWQRGSITFTMSENLLMSGSGTVTYFGITFYNYTLNSYQLRHVKLERGNKATDWSPAPEDVDAAITNAAKTATSYVTEITGQNGIMVHPSTDQTTGVQITDDVDILRDGTSVAEYGETVRIGAESSDHVEIDSNELMFHDGTNAVMQVGGSCQITEKHVCSSSTSEEVFYLSLKPSNGAKFRVIDKNGEIVTSNYTLSHGEKRCTLTNKSGTALDGETVLVFYQSSGMVLYDEGDVSSTFTTDQASFAGGMFEMSYKDRYSSVDGTVTDSTAEISIGEHRDQFSSISLNATPSNNRSFMTFQASGNGYAAFVLDSGSTDYPERRLDLIYLDRINYADPYGGSDRQLGVPTRLTASGSYKAGTSDTMGPHVTLTAGIWIIDGIWNFANSSSNSKRLTIGLYRSSTGKAFTYRVHTTASSNTAHRLEVVDFIVVSASSETVTLYGASSPASTSAATQFINAVRLA